MTVLQFPPCHPHERLDYKILFFINLGDREAPAMAKWLKKKQNPEPKELKTIQEVEEFIQSDDVTVVGFFKV